MEFIFEILFEVYLELMMQIVPEDKATSKAYRAIAICVALVSMIGILALFIWGYVLAFERHNPIGWIPIVIATILSLTQIVLGLVLSEKKDD